MPHAMPGCAERAAAEQSHRERTFVAAPSRCGQGVHADWAAGPAASDMPTVGTPRPCRLFPPPSFPRPRPRPPLLRLRCRLVLLRLPSDTSSPRCLPPPSPRPPITSSTSSHHFLHALPLCAAPLGGCRRALATQRALTSPPDLASPSSLTLFLSLPIPPNPSISLPPSLHPFRQSILRDDVVALRDQFAREIGVPPTSVPTCSPLAHLLLRAGAAIPPLRRDCGCSGGCDAMEAV